MSDKFETRVHAVMPSPRAWAEIVSGVGTILQFLVVCLVRVVGGGAVRATLGAEHVDRSCALAIGQRTNGCADSRGECPSRSGAVDGAQG